MQKRDNAYYIQRLKTVRPDLYRQVQAGSLSVNKARKLAGLGGSRTRLQELKNAWAKAPPAQQADFLYWARARALAAGPATTASTPPPSGTAWDADGRLLAWARRRIPEIMFRRRLSYGNLADELGIKRLDVSVGRAMTGTRVRSASTASAVDAWLKANSAV